MIPHISPPRIYPTDINTIYQKSAHPDTKNSYSLVQECNEIDFVQNYYKNQLLMSFSILFPTGEFMASSKSPEQIQRLTLPTSLTLEQALAHIAVKGLPQQYPYLYKNFPAAHHKVLPFACSKASSEELQNQQIIITSFKKLLQEKNSLLTSAQKELILDACLECLSNWQNSNFEDLSLVIQMVLKSHHDRPKILKKLESQALELGKPNQPSISKVTASRLVTIIGGHSGRSIKNQLVDIIKKIFIDVQVQARKIGISQIFPKILQVFDTQFVELHFQERIFQIVWGEDEEIGVLALEVILKNASKFGQIQQSSRIVKLFVDSLTSKSQKLAFMATSLMGQSYQKLQHVILRSEIYCVRFWKSLVELSQSKNEKILNNMVYNLPGILMLAAPYHKVDPLCDIFIDLFYNPKTNKLALASYFHQMVKLFPSKWNDLRDLFYWMLNQLFEENVLCDEAIKITNRIIVNLEVIQGIFISEGPMFDGKIFKKQEKALQSTFCTYLLRYLDLIIKNKVSTVILSFLSSLKDICSNFSSQFIESTLLPKLYSYLRSKVSGTDQIVQIIVLLLSKEGNPIMTNAYISRITTQLMKSSRSHERDCAIVFFYQCSFHFSIEIIQEYRLGQKFLSFNSDKNYKIRSFFIKQLPRILYFLTKQQKIQYSIIVNRLKKDQSYDIQQIVSNIDFTEDQFMKQNIINRSKQMKEYEKERLIVVGGRRQVQSLSRRPITLKDIKKEDVIRKRIDSSTASKGAKAKIALKEIPKKKITPLMLKANSNVNVNKNS